MRACRIIAATVVALIACSQAQPGFAAVTVLEGGSAPTPSAAPPGAVPSPPELKPAMPSDSNGASPPMSAPVLSAPVLSVPVLSVPTLSPAPPPTATSPVGPLTPPAVVALPQPPSASPAPDAGASSSSQQFAPSVPSGTTPAALLDLAGTRPANQAELAVEMLPGQTVTIGTVVSFKVTSKKPGYIVLMDVDPTGHLTQIYPNTASLVRTTRSNANYVKPGVSTIIPLPTDPFAGVRYVVSPPNGQAMIVGILSASPVQMLDLPDIPEEMLGKPDMVLAYLSKRTSELRIPDQQNQMIEAKWSFDAKPYTIQ